MPDPRYGREHRQLRAAWNIRILRGEQPPCSRCGYPVTPTDQWDLDHTDDATAYLGPAHATCNRAAGGRKSRRLYRNRTRRTRTNATGLNW